MHINNDHNPQGFSLIELSIVLVILGLLAGGIIAGQSLVDASRLRSVTVKIDQLMVAKNTFKQKYRALPGDMKNATRYWGDNATHCADPATTDGAPGTCNGNGDGKVEELALAPSAPSEGYMFWNQLSLAGLIEGKYTGISGPQSTSDSIADVNVPSSRMPNGCYHIDSDNVSGFDRFNADYPRHMLEFGADLDGGDKDCDESLLTPAQAWNIDKKMDDGQPGQGTILAKSVTGCANGVDSADIDADYRLDDDSIQCSLIIMNFP